MGAQSGGRRRIDQVLKPGFAEGLQELDLDEVRRRRAEAEQEETDLSYARRLLHGRLDLLRAEQQRRRSAETHAGPRSTAELVKELSAVLADPPTGSHGMGRHGLSEPSRVGEHRRRAEAAVADPSISDPEALSDEQLAAAAERLDALAREVGEQRTAVQQVMDALSEEIGRRYREGLTSVDDLLDQDR